MKLALLKQQVQEAWNQLNSFNGVVLLPDQFQQELKQFGDARFTQTWVRALARYEAINVYKSCLDAHGLIRYDFNFTPDRWDYEFRYEILDEFLTMPDGLDLIRLGLEQLFSTPFTHTEREEADGFFKLVEGQCTRAGLTTGLVRELTGLSSIRTG